MTVQSRSILPYQCHQLYHTWHPDCLTTAAMLGKTSLRESLKIYCVLYGITSLIKLRKVKSLRDWKKLVESFLKDTIRSTIFLAAHGTFFMPALCTGRRVFGHFSYYKLFFQLLCVTLPAIFIEKKSRRGPLSLYMANIAVEVLFRMATQRQIVVPLHNGEIFLFSVASSIYTYLLKISSDHKENLFLFSAVRLLIGKEECAPSPDEEKNLEKAKTKNFSRKFLEFFLRFASIRNRNAPHCKHRFHCVLHIVLGFVKRFSFGVFIQFLLHFSSSPLKFLRNPLLFFRTLKRNHFDLGKFFAFYCAIYRLIICFLRNFLQEDRPLNGLIAGYFAGFSMIFYKSSTLSMYITSKLIEVMYFKASKDGHVPILSWFDGFLYAISTAMVFHGAIVEPQAVRPSYYRFIERLSGGRFNEVNRPLMDCLGTCSSKLFPNYKLPLIDGSR